MRKGRHPKFRNLHPISKHCGCRVERVRSEDAVTPGDRVRAEKGRAPLSIPMGSKAAPLRCGARKRGAGARSKVPQRLDIGSYGLQLLPGNVGWGGELYFRLGLGVPFHCQGQRCVFSIPPYRWLECTCDDRSWEAILRHETGDRCGGWRRSTMERPLSSEGPWTICPNLP